MSRVRDIIQEITNVRAHRRFESAMVELPLRLSELEQAFESHDRSQTELTRYFPVAIVACIEGYFRMAIRDLVDLGDPYSANAEKIGSTIKLDFSIIRAVHGRKITIGELVAHGIPISRLEHIEAALSSLLGTSFLTTLRSTTDRWAHEVRGEPPKPILDRADEVFADVSRTFELRHVICHEIASAYQINAAEIERCFESCVSFLRTADECIAETLHPGEPLTQTDMNIAAYNSLQDAETRLSAIIAALTQRADAEWKARFIDVHTNWQKYCESWVLLRVGERDQGGTIWPLLYGGIKEYMVEQWISELEQYRDREEGEF